MPRHTERSSLTACIASVLGVAAGEVPLDEDDRRAWLAERGLGMVVIAQPEGFAWAGPWIAWRPSVDEDGLRAVVMFGVPSGVLWDPAGTREEVVGGAVLAPLDVSQWRPRDIPKPGAGIVEAILIGSTAEASLDEVVEAEAVAGRGLEGDRYSSGAGTFGSGRPGSALTLVDASVLEELAAARGDAIDHRRNIVVRGTNLNALVGRRFRLGEAICHGRRLCEPCAHLDRLNGGGLLRPLVHRGGLRADVLVGGRVRCGDALVPG